MNEATFYRVLPVHVRTLSTTDRVNIHEKKRIIGNTDLIRYKHIVEMTKNKVPSIYQYSHECFLVL